jgi:hypothetical protein
VVDVALVAVDGVGAALFVSTFVYGQQGCASVRGAALYDGMLSTLVSEDATRMPTLLWPACQSGAPFAIAAAHGVDELLLASDGDVWRIERVLTRAQKTRLLSVNVRVTALCMRGSLSGASGLALIASEQGIWLYGAPHNVSLWRETGARALACAGRRARSSPSPPSGRNASRPAARACSSRSSPA